MTEPAKLVETLWPYFEFRPIQIESEIITLLNRLEALEPRRILEIGAASGGTTFLFSRIATEGTVIVSIDLGFDRSRSQAVKTIASPGVEHASATRAVRESEPGCVGRKSKGAQGSGLEPANAIAGLDVDQAHARPFTRRFGDSHVAAVRADHGRNGRREPHRGRR